MRLLRKNMQSMKYSLQDGEIPVYETDDNGNIIYIEVDGKRVPVETGDTDTGYTAPVDFEANIAMSGGEAEAQEFGLSIADYNATCIAEKDAYPITEGTLIWHKSKVGYKDVDKTIVDDLTADYMVIKVSESLNFVKYVLKAIVK